MKPTKKKLFAHPRKYYSIYIWLVACLFLMYKYLIVVIPSVLTDHLTEAFHINATQLGLLAGSYFYSFFLFQIPAGMLIDRFGTRHTPALGIAICALGVLIFSFSTEIYNASVGRFLMGFGGSFAFLVVLKLTADWFHHKYFAFIAGLMMTFGMFGAILGQNPFNYIFQLIGWRTTLLDLALVGFILAILYWASFRTTIVNFVLEKPTESPPPNVAFKSIFTKKQNWILFFYSGLAWSLTSVFAGFWGDPFLKIKYQLGDQPVPFVNSMMFFGYAIGAPLLGWISGQIKKRRPILIYGTLASLILYIVVIYLPAIPTPFLVFFLFLLGLAASSYALSFAVIYEINYPIVATSALAFLNCSNALFGAIADPLIGLFLDVEREQETFYQAFSSQTFEHALMRTGIYLAIAFILSFFIKETHAKHKYKAEKLT